MAKSPVPVYAAEAQAGLAQAVAQQNVLAYLSPVLHSPDVLRKQLVTAQVLAAAQEALGSEVTFDLYPVHTILVTTGWNNNDDVFTKAETWAARFTPEDKPFNIGHEPRHIIGHITANTVVDDDLTVIAEGTTLDDIPDKFHILTSAVVYRHLNSRDKTLEAEAAELVEGIQNGDWFVSMECLFGNFDYGITYATGEQQIVARTHATAFLTKHLRIHGGCGEYNGGKLGRVLRNITFSGKGLVENPANPESVIFNDTKRFVGVFASDFSMSETEPSVAHNQELGETNMADEKYTATLEDQNKSLQSELAAANKRIEELGEAQVKSTLSEKDSVIAKLEGDVKAAQAKIDELTASYNETVKARETAEAAKTEAEEKLTEAQEKLDAAEATTKQTARVSQLVDKGIELAEAETVVAEFSDLDDEKFGKVVELKAQAASAKCKDDDEKDKGKGKAKADENAEGEPAADPEGEAAAGDADLENAEPEDEPALGSDDGEGDKDELMTSLASYFDTTMHGTPAGK
jgi:predicted  nucleic acid-binding Zn-ribbon protein